MSDHLTVSAPWTVDRRFNPRALKDYWIVQRPGEFLRMAGRFTTIRRFRTEAGAVRACQKANTAPKETK